MAAAKKQSSKSKKTTTEFTSMRASPRLLEQKEQTLVNHHLLAVGAIFCIVILLYLFNMFYASTLAASASSAPLRSVERLTAPATPATTSQLAEQVYSSDTLRNQDGIYFCARAEYTDCSSFCSQVHLAPTSCMVKIQKRSLDSSICACSKS